MLKLLLGATLLLAVLAHPEGGTVDTSLAQEKPTFGIKNEEAKDDGPEKQLSLTAQEVSVPQENEEQGQEKGNADVPVETNEGQVSKTENSDIPVEKNENQLSGAGNFEIPAQENEGQALQSVNLQDLFATQNADAATTISEPVNKQQPEKAHDVAFYETMANFYAENPAMKSLFEILAITSSLNGPFSSDQLTSLAPLLRASFPGQEVSIQGDEADGEPSIKDLNEGYNKQYEDPAQMKAYYEVMAKNAEDQSVMRAYYEAMVQDIEDQMEGRGKYRPTVKKNEARSPLIDYFNSLAKKYEDQPEKKTRYEALARVVADETAMAIIYEVISQKISQQQRIMPFSMPYPMYRQPNYPNSYGPHVYQLYNDYYPSRPYGFHPVNQQPIQNPNLF